MRTCKNSPAVGKSILKIHTTNRHRRSHPECILDIQFERTDVFVSLSIPICDPQPRRIADAIAICNVHYARGFPFPANGKRNARVRLPRIYYIICESSVFLYFPNASDFNSLIQNGKRNWTANANGPCKRRTAVVVFSNAPISVVY